MSPARSRGPEPLWQEVLRRAEVTLGGRAVGVWEADARGRLHLLASSSEDLAPLAGELEAALRTLGELPGARPPPCRWVASRLEEQRWCIARVRRELPRPPPPGVERRGRERMALELAGVCIGLLGDPDRQAAGARDVENLARLALTVEQVPAILWTTNAELRITARSGAGLTSDIVPANPAELDLVGYGRDEYVGRDVRQFHVDPQIVDDVLRRLRAGESVRNVETRLRHRNGSIRYALLSANARLENGQLVHARCVTRDVTELKRADSAIAYFKAMVESADDAIVSKTLDGTITTWNPAATRLYGYTAEEVIGKPIALIVPPDHRDELTGVFESLRRGEHIEHYETTRMRKDGTRVEVSISISPILDPDGHPVGATTITRDITYRRQAERQLLRGALRDPVTDLPNRASFVERLSQALARTRRASDYRFGVLFVDCDHFKAVNDRLGHAAGDRLLVEIARRLQSSVRPGDVVARLGGDEFTLLLEEVAGLPQVEHVARRVLDSLAAPFLLEGREVRASASIGVVLSERHYEQAQDMLRDADLAMYRAKERGRACFQVFDVEMRNWAHARSGMEADLREALGRKEFRLVFQPIVEIETGRVYAFEALLRWHHGKRRVLLPHEFLPLAEQTGLIVSIGTWVLREACRYARTWQNGVPGAGPVRISVNVSAKQLADPSLVDDLRAALQDAGLTPAALSLEVAESVLMESLDSSIALLNRLREVGIQLHMDDFGSGYSSLSYLPRFPLQGIKVDRTLVHRMGARRTDLEIVRSIVDLAEHLDLIVIAEGVETATQRERLIAFGCELGQGFLFAKALEPEAARALLAEQQQPGPKAA